MPEIDEAKHRVIEIITRAFDGVSREDGVSLHEAIVIDDYGTDEERSAARALDTETRWQDVPEADIEYYYTIFSFLDAKGYRYYLPAYMIWTLHNHHHRNSSSPLWTLFALTLDENPSWAEHQLSLFCILSPDQSAATCAFLRYMAAFDPEDTEEAEDALNRYWGQFCKP
jgi:hypothetical protein